MKCTFSYADKTFLRKSFKFYKLFFTKKESVYGVIRFKILNMSYLVDNKTIY
jgi:hypothetical protein